MLLSGGGTIEVTATAAETISNIGFTVNEGGGSYLVTNAGTTVKMILNPEKTIQAVLNDVLTLGGAGNIEGGDANDMFIGNGGLKKVGTGTLTLKYANSFGGGVELNGGTLIVDHADGMGTNKVLSVTGNAAIGGTSAAYQGLSLSSGVSLDVSAGGYRCGVDHCLRQCFPGRTKFNHRQSGFKRGFPVPGRPEHDDRQSESGNRPVH